MGYVYQAWGDQFHTREQLLGKYSMKKRMLIVSALCSSTGPLFDTSKIICFLLQKILWLYCKTVSVCCVLDACCETH